MPTFRDTLLICEACGKSFIFTVTEQRRLYEQGLPVEPPRYCPTCRLRDPETGKWVGRIKWFSLEKGYGFITKPDGEEIFFHKSRVKGIQPALLTDGQKVRFDQLKTARGLEAINVEPMPADR